MVSEGHAFGTEELLKAISIFQGYTSADGNAGGTTLFCASLIGSNDYLTGKTIVLAAGNALYEDTAISSYNPVTKQIAVNPAFSAQVVSGIPFYVLNYTSAKYLSSVMSGVGLSLTRPAVSLYEGWQNEAGIDLTIWTRTNPATGGAWVRGAVGSYLMAVVSPNANENGRLRSNQRWPLNPTVYGTNQILRGLTVEWEAYFQLLGNVDNANFIMGLTNAAGATRASNNIIGFGLVGGALQTITDDGGTETVNAGFGETLANLNKFKIDISLNSVVFYLNEVLIATHTTNLPNSVMWLNHYYPTGAGGASIYSLGPVRVWTKDYA
jgi:hypothetical protein